jgi:DNA-directed RNA polymerase specialized sigma24 family protein
MQAREDVMLDRAISVVAEGCTAVELADMLHTSESSARRLMVKARGVIAELN